MNSDTGSGSSSPSSIVEAGSVKLTNTVSINSTTIAVLKSKSQSREMLRYNNIRYTSVSYHSIRCVMLVLLIPHFLVFILHCE